STSRFYNPAFFDQNPGPGALSCEELLRSRQSASPDHASKALDHGPPSAIRNPHTTCLKQFLQLTTTAAPSGAIGVSGAPTAQNQRVTNTIGIEGFAVIFSFSLRGTPVNYFQEEATAQFRNRNSGFAAAGQRQRLLVTNRPLVARGVPTGFAFAACRLKEKQSVKIAAHSHSARQLDHVTTAGVGGEVNH